MNDLGVPGVVLKIATKGVSLEAASSDRTLLHAAAGEVWDELVALSVNHDLAGLECLSGIPGHVGATPIQNVGAYGQEVAHTIAGVRAYDRQTGDVVDLAPRQCEFSYRNSIFKTRQPGRYVVLRVSFRLAPGGAPTLAYTELERSFAAGTPELAEVRERVLQLRRAKSMVWSPTDPNRRSCGSFFTNPYVAPSVHEKLVGEFGPNVPAWPQGDRVKLSAGWLIERSGLHKGMTDGAAGLSTKHALALVCHEGATSNDVLRLAHRIRDTVRARTSVLLEPEPNFWGFPDGSERLPPLG